MNGIDRPLLDAHIVAERGDLLLQVAIQVEKGEMVAIMGPNGAGKTSLLYALFGWLPIRSGWILLDGQTLDAPGEERPVPPHRRNLGMVFDDGLLFPHMSVEQNLRFGSTTKSLDSDLADLLELTPLLSRPIQELSAGQRQRVALARTLANNPMMVFLDEPLSSLDPSARAHARDLIKAAFDSHLAGGLLVSHDPADAFALADRVMVLENGEVSQFNSLNVLSTQPATPWIANLIGWNFFSGFARNGTVVLTNGSEVATSDSALQGATTVAINPGSVSLFLEAPGGSPRNSWYCQVSDIQFVGDVARVSLTGGIKIHADVTKSAAAELGLRKDVTVWASVKATEVIVKEVEG